MKPALDLMLFLLGGIAVAGGTVAGATLGICALSGAGCLVVAATARAAAGLRRG